MDRPTPRSFEEVVHRRRVGELAFNAGPDRGDVSSSLGSGSDRINRGKGPRAEIGRQIPVQGLNSLSKFVLGAATGVHVGQERQVPMRAQQAGRLWEPREGSIQWNAVADTTAS